MSSPSERRARRTKIEEINSRVRPFLDPNYFGECNDCGREEKLRADACALEIASPICQACYQLRNYYGPSWYHKKLFGINFSREKAYEIFNAKRNYWRKQSALIRHRIVQEAAGRAA